MKPLDCSILRCVLSVADTHIARILVAHVSAPMIMFTLSACYMNTNYSEAVSSCYDTDRKHVITFGVLFMKGLD